MGSPEDPDKKVETSETSEAVSRTTLETSEVLEKSKTLEPAKVEQVVVPVVKRLRASKGN